MSLPGVLSVIFLFIFCLYPLPYPVECVCSQFIAMSGVSPSGNITSPGWPAPYPPDALCQYKLQGEAWQGIKITFIHFELERRYGSVGCLNDYLEVNTVDIHGQRTFLGRFCGGALPSPILVLHPTAELVFRSNAAVHSNGFVATYEFVDEAFVTTPRLNATSPCGEVVHGIGGTIFSPGYPRGYAAGLDCLWLIRVKYKHAVYLRVQHLEFQGSTANCQKAQLRLYDGYEHSLEDHTVLKKFCGDTRFYKGDEEKVVLSERNRLLVRFTTTEPSKPVNDTESSEVGFRLVWSDVEFDTPANCTKSARFACQETQICFTQNHKGGASSCPDLRHYCVSKQLVCDGVSHCAENDPSDERNCTRAPLMVTLVAVPLALLTVGLCVCFCCFTRNSRNRGNRKRQLGGGQAHPHHRGHRSGSGGGGGGRGAQQVGDCGGRGGGMPKKEDEGTCCGDCCCISSGYSASEMAAEQQHRKEGGGGGSDKHGGGGGLGSVLSCHSGEKDGDDGGGFVPSGGGGAGGGQAPRTRGPIYFKSELESPGASDIVSPASGFSDSESDVGSQLPIYCPAHGPIPLIPVRYLNRHLPLLPAVQEGSYQSDTYDEGGSTYSSGQNSDQLILCPSSAASLLPHHHQHHNNQSMTDNNSMSSSTGLVNEWRLRRGVIRSDAIYISDDGKSSIASSPGRICPRCLEKEREGLGGGGVGGTTQSLQSRPASDSKSPGSCPLNNLDASHHGHGEGQGFVDSGIMDVGDCSILGIDSCGVSSTGGGGGGVGVGPQVKNVSFETCTSSDSAISTRGSRTVSWNTKHHGHPQPDNPTTTLQCRFKQNNLVIEEVTSQSQTNSSVASPHEQQQCVQIMSGGGTNQGIQTDLPSPPPSTITSQDDNNLEEVDQEVARLSREGGYTTSSHPHSSSGTTTTTIRGHPECCGGVGGGGGGSNPTSSAFCVTVTTFGVAPSGTGADRGGGILPMPTCMPTASKATDV